MKKFIIPVLTLLLGGAAGFYAGSLYTEKKLRDEMQEEIKEAREFYLNKKSSTACTDDDVSEETATDEKKEAKTTSDAPIWQKKDITEYVTYAKAYTRSEKEEDTFEPTRAIEMPKPHVITEDKFGIEDEYEVIGATYYSDGVFVNEDGDAYSPQEVEDLIGSSNLRIFDTTRPDDDVIYIQNDKLKIYYEILLDEQTYAEYQGENNLAEK